MEKTEIETRASMRNDKTERVADEYHLAAFLAQRRPSERPYVAALDAAMLTQIGRRLNSMAAANCNYGSTPRRDNAARKLAAQAATIASWYGCTTDCDGDPRGFVLRLHGSSVPNNNFGDGFGAK